MKTQMKYEDVSANITHFQSKLLYVVMVLVVLNPMV